jgi:hypothetical protein
VAASLGALLGLKARPARPGAGEAAGGDSHAAVAGGEAAHGAGGRPAAAGGEA